MSPSDVVRTYFEHFEAGDPAAVADLFTEDASLMPNGVTTVRGKAAIKETFEWILDTACLRCEEVLFDRILEYPEVPVVESRTHEQITRLATGDTDRAEYRELFCLTRVEDSWGSPATWEIVRPDDRVDPTPACQRPREGVRL